VARPHGKGRAATAHVRAGSDAELVLEPEDASLLDIVDNVLNKGVVLSGDLTIGLARVDLVYARLSLLLCAADRVLPTETVDVMERHRQRRARRAGIAASSRSTTRRAPARARRRDV
jgi:hypothetical protein